MLPQPPRRSMRELLVPPAPRDATVVPPGKPGAPNPALYELFRDMPQIARVVETGPGYAVAEDPYGQSFRIDGSRPWRNNNPGNVSALDTDFAERHGSIGKDDKGFAVFPTQKAGIDAMRELLFRPQSKYLNIDTDSLVERYAPAKGGNNVPRYQRFLHQQVQAGDRTLKEMTPQQREALMNAIMRYEGYPKGGKITMGDKAWSTTPNFPLNEVANRPRR